MTTTHQTLPYYLVSVKQVFYHLPINGRGTVSTKPKRHVIPSAKCHNVFLYCGRIQGRNRDNPRTLGLKLTNDYNHSSPILHRKQDQDHNYGDNLMLSILKSNKIFLKPKRYTLLCPTYKLYKQVILII